MKQMGNKGFTLIELIVSTAILGVIVLSVGGFMVVGARSYNSLSYSLRLQYQAQLAMAQIQEYVIDCRSGIQWTDANVLTVVNGSGAEEAIQFVYNETNRTITLQKGGYTVETGVFAGVGEQALLIEDVSDFDVTLTMDDDAALVKSVTLTLGLSRQGKSYTGTQSLSLRNRPQDLSP